MIQPLPLLTITGSGGAAGRLLHITYLRVTLVYVKTRMNTQNITLSLPKDILLQAKLLAVRRGTSISGLLASELEKLVAVYEAYTRARQSYLARLDHAPDLGTKGRITTSRDDLHER